MKMIAICASIFMIYIIAVIIQLLWIKKTLINQPHSEQQLSSYVGQKVL